MRIWYQSYVDAEHGQSYWDFLGKHLDHIVDAGTTVDIRGITPHDSYAHPIVEFRCAREVICNAVRAEREGYDAFVIGHFQDAGLYEARSVVDIPVVGLGEASMLHACQLGQGLSNRVTGVHAMSFQPGQILDAFGDDKKLDTVANLFAEQAKPLVASGVDVLIPGGGIPMLLFSQIQQHVVEGAPVVNGIPIVVKMAEMAVKLKAATGLSTSRVSDFAKPPAEVIEEFMTHPKGL